jgi:hypothetical protein
LEDFLAEDWRALFADDLFVMTLLLPNTSLERTAFTPFDSRFGVRFADIFRGRRSVLGR